MVTRIETSVRDRILRFEEELHDAAATELVPFRWGTAIFNLRVPMKFGLNFLRANRHLDEVTADDLADAAEELMGPRELEHRKVYVQDERTADRLAPRFRDLGWKPDRHLWMVHAREPARVQRGGRARELTLAEHRVAKDEANRRESYVTNDEVANQLLDADDEVTRATHKRAFGAIVDGKVVSMCELFSDGATAQIEDVMTLPEYRRRGLSTDVMLQAMETARREDHEVLFLIADDEDWPKEFYAKLGFDPVAITYEFVKLPPGHPGW